MEVYLTRAIELARAGRKAQAREMLIAALNENPRNATAWKWFASVAQSEYEARQAIQNVLSLDPNDAWARRALATLDSRRGGQIAGQPKATEAGRRGPGLVLAVGLALALAVVCVVGVALAALGSGRDVSALPLAGQQQPGGAPVVAGNAFGPPTLPASWTPAPLATVPTVTPQPTATPTLAPAILDPPPQSDVEFVPIAPPPSTSGTVIETQTIVYYPVTGSNAQEINQSIVANGPKGGGQDAIAQVQYSISLQYSAEQTAAACTPAEAVAYLAMEFTYPQYHPPPDASPTLLDQWNAFLQRVIAHEETHAAIARGCAQDMVDTYYTVSPAASCAGLENNIAAMLNTLDAECEAQQLEFDLAEGGDNFP